MGEAYWVHEQLRKAKEVEDVAELRVSCCTKRGNEDAAIRRREARSSGLNFSPTLDGATAGKIAARQGVKKMHDELGSRQKVNRPLPWSMVAEI